MLVRVGSRLLGTMDAVPRAYHGMPHHGICPGICHGMPWQQWNMLGHAMASAAPAMSCHGIRRGMPFHMPQHAMACHGICHDMPWHARGMASIVPSESGKQTIRGEQTYIHIYIYMSILIPYQGASLLCFRVEILAISKDGAIEALQALS